jgi:NitT/TauT family transport system substrate-binding protein
MTGFRAGQRSPFILLISLVLVLSACASSGGSTPASSTPSLQPSSSAASQATFDPTEKLPNASGELQKVRLAQSVAVMSFAPLLIAYDRNFFGYNGLSVDFVTLQSGATALQAVIGGSIDLSDSASTEVVGAKAKGADLIAVQNTMMMTLQVCVRKDWAEAHGITPDSPLADRLKGLKGATIGITGPGAVSDRAFRYLLIKYGGLDPDVDTTFTQVGGGSAIPAAIDANQIQASLQSPPNCGQTQNGEVLVEPGDVPTFKNYVHEVFYGNRDWIESHPDIVKKVATATSMGNNYILKYPDQALKILQDTFPKVDPAIIEQGFRNTILPQVTQDGKMTAEMWDNTNTVLLDAGIIDKPLSTEEGGLWTNEYIGDATLPYK